MVYLKCVTVDKRETHKASKMEYKAKTEVSVESVQEVGWLHSSYEVPVMGMEQRRSAYDEILKELK